MAYSNSMRVVTPLEGPVAGLVLQVGLISAVAVTAGIGPAGLVAASGFAVGTQVLVGAGMRRHGRAALGPADRVTLVRAVLVGGVTAYAADAVTRDVPLRLVVGLTAWLGVVYLFFGALAPLLPASY